MVLLKRRLVSFKITNLPISGNESGDSDGVVKAANVDDDDEFYYDAREIADTRKTILKQRAHKRNNAKIVFNGSNEQ